jgi:serine/threonine protein kinase
LLRRLEHPNIASVVGTFLDNEGVKQLAYIQMPFYARGTLDDLRDMDEHQVQSVLREVLRGVEHIHRSDVVHCDLKPANIFLHQDSEGSLQPKIGDFDVSRDNGERTTWAVTCATQSTVASSGTFGYMAPELFKGQPATAASDIFSFALMLFDLHFPGVTRPSGLLVSSGRAFSLPAHSNQALLDLLGQILSLDPSRRPTATQALSHPYFTTSLLVKQDALSKQMTELQQQQMAAVESQRQLEMSRFQLEGEARKHTAKLQRESDRLRKQEVDLQKEMAVERKRIQKLGREVMCFMFVFSL